MNDQTPTVSGADREEISDLNTRIAGSGHFLPPYVLTNKMLESMVETSDEWILQRTGIRERRIAKDMTLLDLALPAVRSALESAGMEPGEIDLIVVSTSSPDMYYTSLACRIQGAIGAPGAFCFDVSAACTGFLQAFDIADRYIRTGGARAALVVAAERLSAITDYSDRSSCVLFGDGSAAFVLRGDGERGHVLASHMSAKGEGWETLYAEVGKHTVMNGREVYKFAVRAMPEAMDAVLRKAGASIGDVRWVLAHQANIRIIKSVMDKYGLPSEKVPLCIDYTGNTSSATVPVLYDELARGGKLNPGDLALMVAFGSGLTYGAVLYKV